MEAKFYLRAPPHAPEQPNEAFLAEKALFRASRHRAVETGVLDQPSPEAVQIFLPTTVELNQDQLPSLWLRHYIWDLKCKLAQPFLRLRGIRNQQFNVHASCPRGFASWIHPKRQSNVHSCIYKDAYHNIAYDSEKPANS